MISYEYIISDRLAACRMEFLMTIIKLIWIALGFVCFGLGFIMMERVPAARVILFIVWVCHILYFVFRVKTIKEGGESTVVED